MPDPGEGGVARRTAARSAARALLSPGVHAAARPQWPDCRRATKPLYETLFSAVSATLTEFAASPRHLGGVSAFSLVLHTWKQDLGRHVHLHALVAGGALAANGEWISPKKGFLFPVQRAVVRLSWQVRCRTQGLA
jgi:hypothetical protein